MKETNVALVIETQGAPQVNYAWISHGSVKCGCVCVEIDLKSKYITIGAVASGSGKTGPKLILLPNKDSLYLHKINQRATVVVLPEFVGWDIYCCESSRYTIRLCLVKETYCTQND